jgi:hypothetical protein
VVIAAGALGFFYLRKRRRQAPVRAETPPPLEFPFPDSRIPAWPAVPSGAKLPDMHGNNRYVDRYMAELGGVPRFELP